MFSNTNQIHNPLPPPHDKYLRYRPRGSDAVIEAYGLTHPPGGIIVLAGSKFADDEKPCCPLSARDTRRRLRVEGKLVYRGDFWVLTEPVHFEYLSGAACAVTGCAVRGSTYWRSVEPAKTAA